MRGARLLVALATVAALVDAVAGSHDLARFFGFFTIDSNVLAAAVLLYGAVTTRCRPGWPYLRGAVTVYLVLTGIVYATLLTGTDVGLLTPWVNTVLHRVVPAALAIDYVLFAPWPRAAYRLTAAWLLGPLAYVVVSLLRGPAARWYPYPFLDPRRSGGYPRVIGTCLVIGVVVLALSALLTWIGHRRAPA